MNDAWMKYFVKWRSKTSIFLICYIHSDEGGLLANSHLSHLEPIFPSFPIFFPQIHISVFFPHPTSFMIDPFCYMYISMDGRRFLEVWKYDWRMRRDYAYRILVHVLYDSAPPVSFSFLDRAVRRTRSSNDGHHASFEYYCSRDRALSKITAKRTRSRHEQDHRLKG